MFFPSILPLWNSNKCPPLSLVVTQQIVPQAIQQHQRMYLVRGMMGVATTTNDAAGDFSRVGN